MNDPGPAHDTALQRALDEVARLKADNARLAELLDMAQEFGRLGVWERNARTLEGRWDQHMFRFFGFAPGQTPSFAEAAERVHPDDRLDALFRKSLEKPGLYDGHYRILRPDGTVAHMHSLWRVIGDDAGRAARVVGVMVDDTEARTQAMRIQTAHEQLALALSVSGVGLWRYDIASGRMFHDERALGSLGRVPVPGGLTLDEVRSWIHPDDVADVKAAFDQALAHGGPVDTRTRYRHVDGHWRVVLTRRALQRDASGRPLAIVGVGLDVTEQQEQMVQALQLAHRLETAAEAARVGLWSVPLDGRASEWNAYMYTLLGRDPALGSLSLGDALREYTHPDDRERVATAALAWMRGQSGQTLGIESRIVRPDGAVRWMEVRGHLDSDLAGARRAFGVMLDVTSQREAIDRLREANERATLALSAVGMGTWVHDVRTGHDDWDEQMFRLRGLEPSSKAPDAAQRMALVLPEDRAAMDAVSTPFLETTEPLAYEFRITRADNGALRTLASRSIGLTDALGRVTRRIGINWDVTDARMVERARREREIALRESRTQSALFARISHELRTPLNAVLGFTQLLLAEDARAGAEQRRERLLQIQSAGETLLSTVNGVLELSEHSEATRAAAREAVPLATAVDAALAPLAQEIATRRLRVERGDLSARVSGDGRRVQLVLGQLLSNAVRYNRAGGRLHIGARVAGGEAVVSITDQGPGVSTPRAARLFDAPWGESSRAGTEQGLGLVIAQAMATRMGGRIELAHSSQEGSVFELRLPLAQAAPAAAAPAASGAPRVLYIEDNEVNMLIVRELLAQRPRLAFHGAPDGTSGVQLARDLKPSLVLIDMQLPDFDGLEVLRRLRADPATAGIVCVALSANAMPEDVQRARDAGFDDYWTKPIDLPAFLKAVDRLLVSA